MSSMDLNDGIPDEGDVQIEDLTAAISVMRRLASAQDQLAEHVAAAQAQKNLIEDWLAAANAPLLAEIVRLETALKGYTLHQREASGGRRKNVSTPYGTVSTRENPAKIVVEDEALAIKAAKAAGFDGWVATTEKLSLAVAKQDAGIVVTVEGVMVDATKELLDGFRVEPAAISATVKPAKGVAR